MGIGRESKHMHRNQVTMRQNTHGFPTWWVFPWIENSEEWAMDWSSFAQEVHMALNLGGKGSFQSATDRQMSWSSIFAVITTRARNPRGSKIDATSCSTWRLVVAWVLTRDLKVNEWSEWMKFCWQSQSKPRVRSIDSLSTSRSSDRDRSDWLTLARIDLEDDNHCTMLKLPHFNKAETSQILLMASCSVCVEPK